MVADIRLGGRQLPGHFEPRRPPIVQRAQLRIGISHRVPIGSLDTRAVGERNVAARQRLRLDRVGHTPLLTEPECEAAIDRLLARVAKAG